LTNYYLIQNWDPVRCCTIPGQSGPDNNDGKESFHSPAPKYRRLHHYWL